MIGADGAVVCLLRQGAGLLQRRGDVPQGGIAGLHRGERRIGAGALPRQCGNVGVGLQEGGDIIRGVRRALNALARADLRLVLLEPLLVPHDLRDALIADLEGGHSHGLSLLLYTPVCWISVVSR